MKNFPEIANGASFIEAHEDVPQMQWLRIKGERNKRRLGGLKVGNKWFHSDALSRMQHLLLKDMARDLLAAGRAMTDQITIMDKPGRWKTMDGTYVDMTAQLAFDLVAAAVELDAQLFASAQAHKSDMESSPDPASYDFLAGWPMEFGEHKTALP